AARVVELELLLLAARARHLGAHRAPEENPAQLAVGVVGQQALALRVGGDLHARRVAVDQLRSTGGAGGGERRDGGGKEGGETDHALPGSPGSGGMPI